MTASLSRRERRLDAASAAAGVAWMELPGPELDDASRSLLEGGIGGVVLFGANIRGVDQLRRLTAELRAVAVGPLRIAIDHEGGHVTRIGAPVTRFPSAMAIGATGSEELAHAVARAAGEELASLGIDVNLAPVMDLAADPRNPSVGARSFGSSPGLVARLGAAMVRGYRAAGIAPTAKHFPGHGRTAVDSHLAVATVEGGIEALRGADLPPFRAAIAAGVDLVMASHVVYEGLTDGLPATISPPILRDLLRGELGFEGLLLTDAMVMRALADRRPIAAACVEALAAGADVVMPMRDHQAEAVDGLEAAIGSGELAESRVLEALGRAARLDERLRALRRPPATGVVLPDSTHAELARTVARRSLTLLRGAELLPVDPSSSVAVVELASRRPSPVEEEGAHSATLGAALAGYLPRMRAVVVGGPDDAAGRRAAAEAAAAAELVILATRDAWLWPEDSELVAAIAASERPTVLVALRNPYDLVQLARTAGAIAAYADVPATLEALAEALTGRIGWPGRLPMHLPERLA